MKGGHLFSNCQFRPSRETPSHTSGASTRPSERLREKLWPALVVAWLCTVFSDHGVAQILRPHHVQGAGHRSPLEGKYLPHVEGVVTGVVSKGAPRGFWMESERADTSPITSEGIFIDTQGRPPVKKGDKVRVAGRVRELVVPRRWRKALTVTAIQMADVAVLARDVRLPAPRRRLKADHSLPSTGAHQALDGPLQPQRSALDFWESLEGMRVTTGPLITISPTNRHGDVWVQLLKDTRVPRSRRGALPVGDTQHLGHRILLAGRPLARKLKPWPVGTRLSGSLSGIVSYAYGNYRVQLFKPPGKVRSKTLNKQRVRWARGDGQLALASYNVWNLGGDAKPQAFTARARHIATALAGPDIVVLQEIQDNSGARNDGVEAADVTMSQLVQAIRAEGGPRYRYLQIDPKGGQDGGVPGGNIRIVMLYQPGKVLVVTPPKRQGRERCNDGRWSLPQNPWRLGATTAAFADTRKPLVALYSVLNERYLVMGVHLKSKYGDDPFAGPKQPPVAHSIPKRQAQAALIGTFVREAMACERDLKVIVAGDMNDGPGAAALRPLTEAGLVNLAERLPANERYSYIYQGQGQLLDQIFVSKHIAHNSATQFAVIHVNAEYPPTQRASDHDPVIMSTRIR